MVTVRIRSWRPAMPSISGPRSSVASNFAVTPFVSGAIRFSPIVLPYPEPNTYPRGWQLADQEGFRCHHLTSSHTSRIDGRPCGHDARIQVSEKDRRRYIRSAGATHLQQPLV